MHHNFAPGTTAIGIPDTATVEPRFHTSRPPADPTPASQTAAAQAEVRELRAELEQIRAERNRLAETQRRIMELLNVQSPDKLVHDIRNVLNERELLKALVGDL